MEKKFTRIPVARACRVAASLQWENQGQTAAWTIERHTNFRVALEPLLPLRSSRSSSP
jgi:hypothetical protein